MAEINGFCYLLSLAISAALIIYGFMLLLRKNVSHENDVQVVQRQLRGFAFIMLAQVVLVIGVSMCFGLQGGMDMIRKAIKSARP